MWFSGVYVCEPGVDKAVYSLFSCTCPQLTFVYAFLSAYVVFEKEEQAHAALAFHGHEIGGKHVRVDMAGSSTKKDPKRSVFVGNLTFTANEEAVRQFFSSCGEVDNVRLVRDKKTNLGKGFGYVLFRVGLFSVFAVFPHFVA